MAGSFQTRYYTAGDPQSPTVVLLHDGAWGADGLVTWEAVIRNLAKDHHVIVPDLLGFGGTDKAIFLDRSPYGFRVQHIKDFCHAIGLNHPAHFVGTSFGGSLALRGAAEGTWPVASITSFGGAGGPWRTEEGRQALGELQPGRENMEKIVGMLTNDPTGYPDNVDRRCENVREPGHYAAMVAPGLKHPEQPTRPRSHDYPANLTQATAPVHVVEMSIDPIMESGWAAALAEIAPNVQVHYMEGPHSPNLTQPDEVSTFIREIANSTIPHEELSMS